MKTLRAFFLLLLWPGVVFGATVYSKTISGTVYYESGATSCDDITAADTAADLEAAAVAGGAGGTLYICAGTYTDSELDSDNVFAINSTRANRIIGIGNPVLTSTTGDAFNVFDVDNVYVEGITFDSSGGDGAQVNAGPNIIEFLDCIFSNNAQNGLFFYAAVNGKNINTITIDGGYTTGNGGDGVEFQMGMAAGDASGIYDVYVNDFKSYSNTGRGLYFFSADQANEKGSYFRVNNSEIYSNTNAGMYLRDLDNTNGVNSVQYSSIYENSTGETLGGIWMGSVSYITLFKNSVYNNHTNGIDGRGIYPDGNCTNWVIDSNTIYGHTDETTEAWSHSSGIGVTDGTANTTGVIRNNLIYGNYAGITAGGDGVTGLTVINNTITNNTLWCMGIGRPADQLDSSEITFKNNLCADTNSTANDYGIYDNDAVNDPVESNSLYYGFTDADYQVTLTSPILTDPFLTSDYRLKQKSPARRAGATGLITSDILGRRIHGASDIGAYKSQEFIKWKDGKIKYQYNP